MNNKAIGKKGEDFVAHTLEQYGYHILARNYTKQCGEIDLIATQKNILLFIEVKLRNNPLVDPTELITISKQKKIIKTAKYFLAEYENIVNLDTTIIRFDVALVEYIQNDVSLSYIRNAFYESEQ